jgi:hypothetical protein
VSLTFHLPTKSLAARLAKLVMAMANTAARAAMVAVLTVVAFLCSEGICMGFAFRIVSGKRSSLSTVPDYELVSGIEISR